MSVAESETVRTYGNYRKPNSAGLFGLGSIGTGFLFAGLLIVVFVAMVSGLLAALVTLLVIGGVLLAVLMRDADGLNLLNRTTARATHATSRRAGTNLYRSGPLGRSEWGTYQLPGLAAPMLLSEHSDSYSRPFALLYTPAQSTFTVVIGTEPDGSSLVDQDQIDIWVARWGGWLAQLGNEPSVVSASVTVETSPDTGSRLATEVGLNVDEDAPLFAKEMLAEIVSAYPAGSSTVKAYVAVTFSAAPRPGAKKREAENMARDLASRLPHLTSTLQATGAGATRLLSAQELCEVVRIAYDPASAQLIDDAHAIGEMPELRWSDVGPSAHQRNWDSYRHDSGLSASWVMSNAPRGNVQSSVLARLLAPHRDITRKRVTLLYRPIDPARAAAIVETDKTNAMFKVQSATKPSARAVMDARAAVATAEEEAAGAGLVNFGMIVTATVTNPEGMEDARAAIDNLGPGARLRLRPAYGSQDAAFAAALPLGLDLPAHLALPSEIRDRL